LPGVKPLLDELSKTRNLVVLYTGDSPGVTQLVLKATGLSKYFKFSVYGTEAKSRVDMARLAIKKAEQLTGDRFKGKDVVIVGDSVRDIECGKQLNALTIAVATGFYSRTSRTIGKCSRLSEDFLIVLWRPNQVANMVRIGQNGGGNLHQWKNMMWLS
jgi:phosphoglycolate phosphatase-like HAD superfamily hydrolase